MWLLRGRAISAAGNITSRPNMAMFGVIPAVLWTVMWYHRNHQYCQPLPHLRPVSSHSQGTVISPLLKKPTLDKEELSNYRPISNLSLVSKIIEHVVKSRLMDHLTSNSLLNPHQSAYCKHHSTETALLYIHDHLISAIGSQKVSCLCLLDLSAAFDTIDHDVLITRLSSWFGIQGSVLSWFKSYLSSRCFRVKCETDLSSWYISS